jgi:hypothetical protein
MRRRITCMIFHLELAALVRVELVAAPARQERAQMMSPTMTRAMAGYTTALFASIPHPEAVRVGLGILGGASGQQERRNGHARKLGGNGIWQTGRKVLVEALAPGPPGVKGSARGGATLPSRHRRVSARASRSANPDRVRGAHRTASCDWASTRHVAVRPALEPIALVEHHQARRGAHVQRLQHGLHGLHVPVG